MTRRALSPEDRERLSEDHYEYGQPFDDDEIEEDCGLMPDGQCLLAGTEHCDWDCGKLRP